MEMRQEFLSATIVTVCAFNHLCLHSHKCHDTLMANTYFASKVGVRSGGDVEDETLGLTCHSYTIQKVNKIQSSNHTSCKKFSLAPHMVLLVVPGLSLGKWTLEQLE